MSKKITEDKSTTSQVKKSVKDKKNVSQLSPTSKKTSTKKINQIDPITNVVINTFNSINKAETSLKIYHIKRACDGQTKMAGGFKWEYAN